MLRVGVFHAATAGVAVLAAGLLLAINNRSPQPRHVIHVVVEGAYSVSCGPTLVRVLDDRGVVIGSGTTRLTTPSRDPGTDCQVSIQVADAFSYRVWLGTQPFLAVGPYSASEIDAPGFVVKYTIPSDYAG